MKVKPDKIVIGNEHLMCMALRTFYSQPEHVLIPQVRNGTGFTSTRTADAIAMSVWPSRGLALSGIEIKVSRSDWLRELKNPKKADEIGRHCDYWVLAVGDEAIVKDGELPINWGLLVPGSKPNTLRMKFSPSRFDAEPISRSFLASILRRAFEESVPFKEVEAEIKRRVDDAVAKKEAEITARLLSTLDKEQLSTENANMKAVVKTFEEASGQWIGNSTAQAKKLGHAFKLLSWRGIEGFLTAAIKQSDELKTNYKVLLASLPRAGRLRMNRTP